MPDEAAYQVFNYVADCFIQVPVVGRASGEDDTCERVCRAVCEQLKIKPVVFALVGLRLHDEKWFLAGGSRPSTDKKYDFRLRFKVPDLSCLKALDQELFNYYYSQLRYDLLHNRIPEIDYRKYKNKILGYVVNDMYRKMIEDKVGLSELKRDFEKYIPRKISREHSVCFVNVAQKRIFESLNSIQNRDHDVNYVKNVYINDIDNIAPGYLYEEYAAEIQYPRREFSSRTGKCPVKLRFQPYGTAVSSRETTKYGSTGGGLERTLDHEDATTTPGLKVFYASKWQHVTNIDEILTILVEKLTVKLALEDQSEPYCIDFHDQTELNSFVTCLAGYYRLMCKWTVYLCQDYLSSPMLNLLKELKCHGPIGGKYSTDKIREKNSSCGACIIRQCEEQYDTYYVDMLETDGLIKTYKLIHAEDQWHVQRDKEEEEVLHRYNQLTEALKSLNPEITSVYRLPPSDNDTAPNLLLCRPTHKASPKRLLRGGTQELGQKRACIINAAKELVINRNAVEDESDGYTKRTRADFLLPNNSKMEVTLKLLKNEKEGEYLKDFLQVAGQWATIDSIDIIKLYGMTVCKPITMVLEFPRYGRLDEFLRTRRTSVRPTALIEIGHSLARALYYLQKHGIIHGHIRCSSMLVTQYDEGEQRVLAKLGDPGMHGQRRLTKHDLLWIPYEYQDLSEQSVARLRADPATDAWACTSTLWEIFSRGIKMHVYKPAEFLPTRKWLQTMPPELKDSKQIYECLSCGWHADPDKRLAPQTVVGLLVHARQLDGSYCTVGNGHVNGHSTSNMLNGSVFKNSILSMETNSTLIRSRTDCTSSSYVSNGSDSELRSNASSGSSSLPLLSNSINRFSGDSYYEKTFVNCSDYIQLSGSERIFFHNMLGEGNYGRVYRGTLERDNQAPRDVALKTIYDDRPDLGRVKDDFRREVDIMKNLRHTNIVEFICFIEELDKLVVVMEYVPLGSLLAYLGYMRYELKELDLLWMARDIANGMNYLCEKNIVHRDLAARNILVESKKCVKISDFGLAQVTEGSNYYVARHSRELPIRWYAPETLETQKYSSQSDVWSFGVTLYEMFTYGATPYSHVDVKSAAQLYQLLQRETKILQLPEDFSYVYDKLMAPCFKRDPHERMTFSELLEELNDMINQYGEPIY
ncbi:tyrosine-protein kinase hopscotch [Anopheles merus]|uniref:Non-specific protein-tyrosine kinase n=1 Tax=Anopheles merus TaxID=30066 RepID=A0A182V2N7_ANOME|nr:tyrosine-protein kinase hopscotch [Anopheles merus]XP_041774913.1 tyrosine-protein kinase hopscotch [Anopheles merus]XP_041774914.1 tyrosine-protein kinase hopscotch [Anopheles merus]